MAGPSDIRLLITLRGLRGVAYGFFNTALGLYLNDLGYGLLHIGLLVTVAGLSSAALVLISGVLADRLGSRKIFLTLSCLLTAALGIVYSSTYYFPLLLLGSALGGAGSAGGGVPGGGPFGPAQQALLADKVKDKDRNAIFTINSFVGTALFSLGAGSAGLPEFLSSSKPEQAYFYKLSFIVFAILGIAMAILSFMVSEERCPKIEQRRASPKVISKFLITATLNGFGIGLIPLPLLTLWFRITYRASDALISSVVGASNLVSAFSLLFAPILAKWLGSVKMIVSTRLIGTTLLASLPLMPYFSLASLAYVVRGIFVSVGMPIRQSYMMGLVESEERATAVGVTSGIGWGFPYAVSPVISGYIMEEVSSNLPIYLSALLQMANSALYYAFFHQLHPSEEVEEPGGH